MAFTAQEIQNIANAALDFYIKGAAMSQIIQDQPLLDLLMGKQKTFPGGKGNISIPVKGVYTTAIMGYTHDDQVTYANPANIKRAAYPWKEIHAGISLTLTELKMDGISVVDSMNGAKTTEHSDREETVLTSLLEDKLEDMAEGWARTFQKMMWQDGTQDAKQVPGIIALLPDDPTTGTLGGLDRVTNPWWRHRVLVGTSKITASGANSTLILALRKEVRQLRRFGGRPTVALCGSDFLAALEMEIHAKGYYSFTGFNKTAATDISMAEPALAGIGFQYEPSLDDLAYNKRAYIIDPKHIVMRVMEGEDRKTHTPARPFDRYVMYRAMTWTGGLTLDQPNANGIYEVA